VKGAWSRWLAVAKLRQSDGASERLGVHLLVRTTRRVNLTEDGAAFLDRCRRILADLEEAEMVLRRARVTPTGRLRIDMPVSFGRLKVVPLLGAFQTEYPELSLALSFTDRYVDLVEEGIDVAIRIGALQDSSLIARRVTQTRFRIFGAPIYFAIHGRPSRRCTTTMVTRRRLPARSSRYWYPSSLPPIRSPIDHRE
jgi:DNA-binding transcriptional LysR family regulator